MARLLEVNFTYTEEQLKNYGYEIKTVDSGEMYAEDKEGNMYSIRFHPGGWYLVDEKIDKGELKESFKDKKKKLIMKKPEEITAYAAEYRNMHDAVHYLLIVDERDIAVLIAQGLQKIEEAVNAGDTETKEIVELELSNYDHKEKKINFRDIIEENGVRYFPVFEGAITKEYIEIVNNVVPDIYAADESFTYEKKRIIMKHVNGQGLIEWEEGMAKEYDNKGNMINEREVALNDLVIEGYHQDSEDTIKIQATHTKKYNKKTKQQEWALVSKKDPNKILQWFGTQKPSDDKVQKVEKRVQWFKNKGSINAAFIEIDTVMGENAKEDKKFFDYLKKNNIKHKVVEEAGPAGGWPIVKYTGSKEALMKMIKEKFDDEYLIEEIEGENKGSKIKSTFRDKKHLIDFLENTLIPDLNESYDETGKEKSPTVEDFEALIAFLKGAKSYKDWSSAEQLVSFLENTLIPDLQESYDASGKEKAPTAEDFEEGIRFLKEEGIIAAEESEQKVKAYFGIDYTQLQDLPTKILEAFKRTHEGIKAIKDIEVSELKGDDYPYFEIKDFPKLDVNIQSDIMQWIKSAKFLKVKNNKVSLDTKKIEAQVNPMTRDNLERANEIILNGVNDIEDILEEVRKSILSIPTEPSKVLMAEYKKIKNAIPKSVDKWKDQIYSIKKLIDDVMRYEDAGQPKTF